jgi:hypothetical protein
MLSNDLEIGPNERSGREVLPILVGRQRQCVIEATGYRPRRGSSPCSTGRGTLFVPHSSRERPGDVKKRRERPSNKSPGQVADSRISAGSRIALENTLKVRHGFEPRWNYERKRAPSDPPVSSVFPTVYPSPSAAPAARTGEDETGPRGVFAGPSRCSVAIASVGSRAERHLH